MTSPTEEASIRSKTKMGYTDAVLLMMQRTPKGITHLDVFRDLGTYRLSAIIWTLVHERGIVIDSEFIKAPSGKRVKLYWLRAEQSKLW